MTEEFKKQGIADGAAVAETVEETGVAPDLDEAAKAAAHSGETGSADIKVHR